MKELIRRVLGIASSEPSTTPEKKETVDLMVSRPKIPRLRNPVTGCYCEPHPEWQEYCHCWS